MNRVILSSESNLVLHHFHFHFLIHLSHLHPSPSHLHLPPPQTFPSRKKTTGSFSPPITHKSPACEIPFFFRRIIALIQHSPPPHSHIPSLFPLIHYRFSSPRATQVEKKKNSLDPFFSSIRLHASAISSPKHVSLKGGRLGGMGKRKFEMEFTLKCDRECPEFFKPFSPGDLEKNGSHRQDIY